MKSTFSGESECNKGRLGKDGESSGLEAETCYISGNLRVGAECRNVGFIDAFYAFLDYLAPARPWWHLRLQRFESVTAL